MGNDHMHATTSNKEPRVLHPILGLRHGSRLVRPTIMCGEAGRASILPNVATNGTRSSSQSRVVRPHAESLPFSSTPLNATCPHLSGRAPLQSVFPLLTAPRSGLSHTLQ